MLLPISAPAWGRTCNLRMCPNQEWNPKPFGLWDNAPTNRETQPGHCRWLFMFIPYSISIKHLIFFKLVISMSSKELFLQVKKNIIPFLLLFRNCVIRLLLLRHIVAIKISSISFCWLPVMKYISLSHQNSYFEI